MTTFHIGDLHFRHNNILKFSGDYRDGDTVEEHNHILVDKWNSTVSKRDVVYIHGDIGFGSVAEILKWIEQLRGIKHLILGNHDPNARHLVNHFDSISGIIYKWGYCLSHAPVHPVEIRGKRNIHGHTHMNLMKNSYGEIDDRYINVCVEATDGFPIAHEEIVSGRYKPRGE